MYTKLIAALACAAALALGACSGGNPPAPADPDPDPADPSTADPAPGTTDPIPETTDPPADARTPAERFDAAHANAAADLAAARSMVTAAATTSAGIAAARKALTDALVAARALEAPPDDSERIARAARLSVQADTAEAEDLPRLRAAEIGAGWSSAALAIGSENLRPVPVIPGDPRTRRRNAANTADAETLLTAAKIPAVAYEDGKIVISPGLASTGDRLRMRGIPIFQAGTAATNNARQFLFYGPLNLPEPYLDPVGGGNDGGDPRLVAGLTITPGGLVVDMGGRGAPGLDLRFHSSFANSFETVAPDGSNDGYDLKLTFGPPGASPEGNAEHYWTATLMPSSDHVTTLGNRLSAGRELGTYVMRLSNHVGLDRNLEDPEDPAASASDDVNRYLSYAAYGHMEFFDSFVRSGNFAAGQVAPGRRTFPFHAGYDAFKDEAGMRTTDVAEADKIVGGTFRGRTLASQFAIAMLPGPSYFPALIDVDSLTRRNAYYLRLRGDVTLTATISGTAADNGISGKITNLESFNNGNAEWEDYATIPGVLTLQATAIGADGEFKGVIDTASLMEFTEGGYKGNFYGPLAGLEAAGIWYLQDGVVTNNLANNLSIVGSFGAALVREGGAYGVAIGPVGD